MKLVAIDFETADYGADSACALGIVAIESEKITRKGFRLIRPSRRKFMFTYLHGISWLDVQHEAGFAEVWDGFKDIWQSADYFVAHNAPFDRGVLSACLRVSQQEPPGQPFICTVKVARSHWHMRPANLSHVCKLLGIPLRHHDAASDALASASIALQAMKEGFPIQTAVIGNART